MASNLEISRLFKQLEATGATFRQETRTGPKITADAVSRAMLPSRIMDEDEWMMWLNWNRAPGT